ncbi:MAG: hypothetical protein IJM59_07820 [Proteobacteria bacterium]|nr:hypothetical protein [Pseudomonadota bacterium]
MRKCPNCKKAVPVGARRCVYCRTILGESENEDYGNSTQLGFLRDRDSGSFSQNNVMQRRNGAGGYQDGGVHQTMIGLGPIPAGTGRGSDNDRGSNQGFAQRTMAGMPGISFDAQHPNGTYRMGAQSSAGASGSGWRVEPNYQSQNNAMPVDPIQIQARTPERPMKPVAQRDPVIEKKAEPVIPPPQAKAGTENVLAGLPGVAPMPSSLVDEEFVDLTSKLFGAEFAEVNQVDEEEEDGFDFDAPAAHPASAAPAAPAAPLATPLSGYPTLKPPADAKSPDKPAAEQKSADKSVAEPKAEDKHADEAKVADKPAAEQKESATEAKHDENAASHKSKLSTMMFAALVSAGLSALMAILWFVMASGSINWDSQMMLALVIAAAANVVIDAVCLVAYKKFSSMTLAILFFVGVVLFMGAAVMASGNILALPLFALAMVAQLAAAICCFLKKN